jgi:hypothetical protein
VNEKPEDIRGSTPKASPRGLNQARITELRQQLPQGVTQLCLTFEEFAALDPPDWTLAALRHQAMWGDGYPTPSSQKLARYLASVGVASVRWPL